MDRTGVEERAEGVEVRRSVHIRQFMDICAYAMFTYVAAYHGPQAPHDIGHLVYGPSI